MNIHAGKILLQYKTILNRAPSMKKLIDNRPLLESIVQDNYLIDNNKLWFNQTAIDLFAETHKRYIDNKRIASENNRKKINASNNSFYNPRNNPINNPERDLLKRTKTYELAPPIIMCSTPFIDEETRLETYLEMRGTVGDLEAENYFQTAQLEGFLGYSDINHTLTSFLYDIDYVRMLVDVNKPPETFLTYEGFFKFINRSRKPNIIALKRLFKKIVFNAIFGSDEKKAELEYVASDLNAITITKLSTCSSGCYRLDIGSVEQVFGEDGILEKPVQFNYTDDQRVYKIGKANNIQTRLDQHKYGYFIKNVIQRHDVSFILAESIKDRTYSLESKIFRVIDDNKTAYKSTKPKGGFHNEIFILTYKECTNIDDEIIKLTIKDLPPMTTNELLHERELLEKTIINLENIVKQNGENTRIKEYANNKIIKSKEETEKIFTKLIREARENTKNRIAAVERMCDEKVTYLKEHVIELKTTIKNIERMHNEKITYILESKTEIISLKDSIIARQDKILNQFIKS